MSLWSYFNISGGYFEPVTSRLSVKVELLETGRLSEDNSPNGAGLFRKSSSAMSSPAGYNRSLDIHQQVGDPFQENVTSNLLNVTSEYVAVPTLSTPAKSIFILLYTATTSIAIIGNIIAIIIFAKGKRSRTDLRPFLINLAVADLIMAIFCIPFTFTDQLLDEWVFSRPMCPIVLFLQTVSVTASVSTNMAIGIDRFYAVMFPLKSRITTSRYRLIILLIWIFTISFNVVQLVIGRADYIPDTQILKCKEEWPDDDSRQVFSMFVLVVTYIVPLVMLTVTYSIVGYTLFKHRSPGNADAIRDQQQLKSKRKVVKMLVTIVMLFGLCWLPLHTFILVLDFNRHLMTDETILPTLNLLYFFAHWIAMSNSFVNPIIYGSMNDNFLGDLRTLIFRVCPYNGSNTRHRHGAVKWKARNHVREDNINYDKNNPLKRGLLDRSTTEYHRNGNVMTSCSKDSVTKTYSV